jgi:hypothetical protein
VSKRRRLIDLSGHEMMEQLIADQPESSQHRIKALASAFRDLCENEDAKDVEFAYNLVMTELSDARIALEET